MSSIVHPSTAKSFISILLISKVTSITSSKSFLTSFHNITRVIIISHSVDASVCSYNLNKSINYEPILEHQQITLNDISAESDEDLWTPSLCGDYNTSDEDDDDCI